MGAPEALLAAVVAASVGSTALTMSRSKNSPSFTPPPRPQGQPAPSPPPLPPDPPNPMEEALREEEESKRRGVAGRKTGRAGTILTGSQGLLTPPKTSSGGMMTYNTKLGGGK